MECGAQFRVIYASLCICDQFPDLKDRAPSELHCQFYKAAVVIKGCLVHSDLCKQAKLEEALRIEFEQLDASKGKRKSKNLKH